MDPEPPDRPFFGGDVEEWRRGGEGVERDAVISDDHRDDVVVHGAGDRDRPGLPVGIPVEDGVAAGLVHGELDREDHLVAALSKGLLEEVGLGDARAKRIRGYSQGMRQRLALAAALLREPDLLILDEPMNGLDPAGMSWLRELLAGLAARGTTVVFSSHQLGEVERLCGRVAVLDHGRLVELAKTADIGATSDRVRVTLAASSRATAVGALAAYNAHEDLDGALLVDGATVPQVIAALAGVGVYPESVERERTSLEQRFLEVTGGS